MNTMIAATHGRVLSFDRGRTPARSNESKRGVQHLWTRYKRHGDERAREQLVIAHAPLVKAVAGRMGAGLPDFVDQADLIAFGFDGLLTAIERFEPARGLKFETYAAQRIKGAILDELRAMDWLPRSVRSRARQIEHANVKLTHRLHRAPTDEELAAELGLDVDDVRDTLQTLSTSTMLALEGVWTISDISGEQVALVDTLHDDNAPDPIAEMDLSDLKDRLAHAIAQLPERERIVVGLYYYERLTLGEIARVLDVSESRCSQLNSGAMLRLRGWLAEEQDVELAIAA